MELLTYIVLFSVIVFLVALLPLFNGVAHYKVHRTKKVKDEDEPETYEGYIPPDEQKRIDEKQAAKNLKFQKLQSLKNLKYISKDDIPLKFKPKLSDDHEQSLRNRRYKKKLVRTDNNPSNYDYDLDELINDELENDAREEHEDSESRYFKDGNLEELA